MESPVTEDLKINWWIQELNLSSDDKHLVISGDWLNDKIIDAVNRICNAVINNDAQTTLLSQTQTGFKAIANDGINILHDKNHWVATACLGGRILFADYMGGQISDHVKMQARQLYTKHLTTSGYINVEIVPVQK